MEPIDYLKVTLQESVEIKRAFVEEHANAIVASARKLGEAIQNGNKVLIFGNGGSAADSQHMACEMVGRFLIERAPLPAIALSTDTSALTCVGNDYGYEHVFDRQVRGLAKAGDVCVAFSTSGNSKNVLLAVESARKMGCLVIALTGGNGGALKDKADFWLNARLGKNSPRVQETHVFAMHSLVDLVDRYFLKS